MIATVLAAAALAAGSAQGTRPPVLRLNAAQTLRLAVEAEKAGRTKIAEQSYFALARDPNPDVRAEARFRHGQILAQAGKLVQAAELLRRLLDEKPNATRARLELANLLNRMGASEQALRELRAAQASGLPPAVARIVDRYSEAIRAARPTGASLEIAIAPDSNVSRATNRDTLQTVVGDFEIDQAAKARSGLGLRLGAQAFRRFGLGGSGHNVLARVTGSADLYRRTDYSDIALDVSAGPELHLGRSRLNLSLGATQRWYGFKPSVRSARLDATWSRPIGARSQLRLSSSAGLIDNQVNDLQDGKFASGQLSFEHALSSTTGIGATLGTDRVSARDAAYSTTNRRIGAFAWRDVGRTTMTIAAEFGRLNADDRLVLLPETRSDRFSRFTFGATFRQFSFGGFAPVSRLVIERNRSTVEFYDYSRTRTEIGIVRAF
jgi:tetratricopeptide (TPR) repeat protein